MRDKKGEEEKGAIVCLTGPFFKFVFFFFKFSYNIF